MDAFDEQMNVAYLAGAGRKFLLHFVEIVYFDVFGRFGRRAEQRTCRGTLVITLQPCPEDGDTYRLAAEATKSSLRAIQRRAIIRIGSNG